MRVVDATCVSRPGSKGTDWRLHVGFDLATLTLQQVELTDASGGETFKRLPARPGEITLADRGYSQRQGLAALGADGGQVIVRVNWSALPLQTPTGGDFDLFTALEILQPGEVGEWAVQTVPHPDRQEPVPAVPGRLVALRKAPAAIEVALRKLHQEYRKKGKTPSQRTLKAAGFIILFTTVPVAVLTTVQVAELYRFRWQIELNFKRWKSLLALGDLPVKDPAPAQTYLLAKLLAAALIEELSHRWVGFPPWGYGRPTARVPVAGL